MAYGKKYTVSFKNRIQNDVFRCEIWEKDFVGDSTELTGAETPFAVSYQNGDTDILAPIQSLQLTLSINTQTLSIEDFYSDDDENFRLDFYCESAGATTLNKLLYSTYLVQDGTSEPLTDRKHVITLKATDNLGLLKNVKWNEVEIPVDYNQKLSLIYFIQYSLKATGLYSPNTTIDMSLPLRVYDNLFENTRPDRGDDIEADPLQSTVLHANMFQNSDGTWQDLYTVLETVLKSLNATLIQANGYWNVIRIPEYKLFDGAIPGTEYFDTTTVNAVTLGSAITIDRNGTIEPIAEDQTKNIQRPVKLVKNTFNYKQPGSFIKQNDLQLPPGATPYATSTVSGIRYDKYALATYFPEWTQRKSDASYLQVETDTTTTPENEINRYIVSPGLAGDNGSVQFPAIDVTKGDSLDFSLQFKMLSSNSNQQRFWIRFTLIQTDGNHKTLVDDPTNAGFGWYWNAGSSANFWDEDEGWYYEVAAGDPKTDWLTWSFSSIDTNTKESRLRFPADGMLIIDIIASNGGNPSTNPRYELVWKDISLSLTQFINESTKIIGQTHTDTGISTNKAIKEDDIDIDDSPRNPIAGTLFINDLTNFDYTDSVTGEATNIGDIFFTRTKSWHRGSISEELRLGNIITQERLKLNYTSRQIIEGTFKNLRYGSNEFVSMLSLFEFGFITGKKFLLASATFDYMACTFNGRLIEIYKTGESFTDTYLFNYLYKTD